MASLPGMERKIYLRTLFQIELKDIDLFTSVSSESVVVEIDAFGSMVWPILAILEIKEALPLDTDDLGIVGLCSSCE